MNHMLRNAVLAFTLVGGSGLHATAPIASAADAATVQKQKQDYENRKSSVKALSDVLKKDADKPGAKETLSKLEARSIEAEGLATAGEYEIARTILDEGYNALTTTLARIKSAPASGNMAAMSGMADPGSAERNRRDAVARDIAGARSLIDPLKRQNVERNSGKAAEIAAIEADVQKAEGLLAAGRLAEADKLIDEATGRAKMAFSGMAKATPSMSETSGMSGMADPAYAAKRERELVERDIVNTTALIDALKRQNSEKNAGKGNEITRIEADAQQARSLLASGKVAEADKLIDGAYNQAKATIAGMQKASGVKTGSAALEADGQRDMKGMSGEARKSEIDARLKSVATLRDALKRRNPNAAEIARTEQLLNEAGRLTSSNPEKAMTIADEAYELVKSAMKSATGS